MVIFFLLESPVSALNTNEWVNVLHTCLQIYTHNVFGLCIHLCENVYLKNILNNMEKSVQIP